MNRVVIFLLLISLFSSCDRDKQLLMTSTSMERTIKKGDLVSIKPSLDFSPGDIVAFNHDNGEEKMIWIFRIIGTPGDTVRIKDGNVFVNNRPFSEGNTLQHAYNISIRKEFDESIIQGREYFHLNDTALFALLTHEEVEELSSDKDILNIKRSVKPPDEVQDEIFREEGAIGNNIDHYGPVVVPTKSFFLLGDSRNNALDSRFIGFVRKKEIIGKVRIEKADQ